MVSFAGLLKREWLEHRAGFIWGPAIVLAVILLAGLSAVGANNNVDVSLSEHERSELTEKLGEAADSQLGFLEAVAAMALDVAGSTDAELEYNMSRLLNGIAQPFHLVFIVLAFFALLACLYDERKDQSIVFWKSMPVSDWQTVASKLVFIVWLAPLVTILAIVFAQFFAVSLSVIYVEEGMGGRIWSASDVIVRPIGHILRYLLLGLWALPLCGWVMFVSSVASRLPVLWATGIPWLVLLLEQIIFGSSVLRDAVIGHFSTLTSLPVASTDSASGIAFFAVLGDLRTWGGVVVALAFLSAAVFFRRRNNEL